VRQACGAVVVVALVLAGAGGAVADESGRQIASAVQPRAAVAPVAITQSDETLTKIIRLRSKLKNFRMTWDPASRGNLLTGFTAELGGGKIVATGRINWLIPRGTHHLHLRLDGVDFKTALTALNMQMDGRVVGRLSGEMEFEWSGLRLREIKQTATGRVRLTLSEGEASRMTILRTLSTMSGIRELETIRFNGGEMTARVRDGRIEVERLIIATPDAEFEGRGWCVLATEEMLAEFEMSVRPSLALRSHRHDVRVLGGRNGDRMAGLANSAHALVRVPGVARFAGTLSNPAPLVN
jgi:hypothetical protein